MSDPTLSDIDFKNKMATVWTTLQIVSTYLRDGVHNICQHFFRFSNTLIFRNNYWNILIFFATWQTQSLQPATSSYWSWHRFKIFDFLFLNIFWNEETNPNLNQAQILCVGSEEIRIQTEPFKLFLNFYLKSLCVWFNV